LSPVWFPDKRWLVTGLPDFLDTITQKGENIPNDHKLYQTAINNTKWPQYIHNGHKICQRFPFQGRPKFTQIWIFGFKTNHLATPARNEKP
jgi:hypothetical protein